MEHRTSIERSEGALLVFETSFVRSDYVLSPEEIHTPNKLLKFNSKDTRARRIYDVSLT